MKAKRIRYKDIILIFTYVYVCSNCKQRLGRAPKWSGIPNDNACPKCGCTSYNKIGGRSYGRKSTDFKFWIEDLKGVDKEQIEYFKAKKYFKLKPSRSCKRTRR